MQIKENYKRKKENQFESKAKQYSDIVLSVVLEALHNARDNIVSPGSHSSRSLSRLLYCQFPNPHLHSYWYCKNGFHLLMRSCADCTQLILSFLTSNTFLYRFQHVWQTSPHGRQLISCKSQKINKSQRCNPPHVTLLNWLTQAMLMALQHYEDLAVSVHWDHGVACSVPCYSKTGLLQLTPARSAPVHHPTSATHPWMQLYDLFLNLPKFSHTPLLHSLHQLPVAAHN